MNDDGDGRVGCAGSNYERELFWGRVTFKHCRPEGEYEESGVQEGNN